MPVDDVSRVVTEVWREACRHIELESAVTAIAKTIAAHGPFRAAAVICPDHATRMMEARAVGWVGRRAEVAACTSPLDGTAWQKLLRWLRDGDLVHTTTAAGSD